MLRLRIRKRNHDGVKMHIICITNNKGGVGKTTSTVNIGYALADKGYKVLVIDADPQCNTTYALLGNLEHAARDAQITGEINKEVDVRQLAFEIQALAMGANWSSRLFRDGNAFRLVRGAILERIDRATETVQLRQ